MPYTAHILGIQFTMGKKVLICHINFALLFVHFLQVSPRNRHHFAVTEILIIVHFLSVNRFTSGFKYRVDVFERTIDVDFQNNLTSYKNIVFKSIKLTMSVALDKFV